VAHLYHEINKQCRSRTGNTCVLRQRSGSTAMRNAFEVCTDPYMGALKNFGTLWDSDYDHGYFPPNFWWTFVLIDPVNMRTKFEVHRPIALPVPEIIGVTKKLGIPWICPRSLFSKFLMRFSSGGSYKCTCQNRIRSFTCSWVNRGYPKKIRGGLCPHSLSRPNHPKTYMVPPERALVSSYRPSMVTFLSIFTRFRDIVAFVLQNATFSLPHISPKFSHVPLGVGGSLFGYKERRCWANSLCS